MVVKELTKKYDGKPVVDSVSFEIPKGKILSLIGPNGAGKSTVMGASPGWSQEMRDWWIFMERISADGRAKNWRRSWPSLPRAIRYR